MNLDIEGKKKWPLITALTQLHAMSALERVCAHTHKHFLKAATCRLVS